MWLVVAVVVAVVAVATYVTWIATRVDRLHARAAAAYSALDAQSVRRAAAAAGLGDRNGVADLQTAAKAVLTAAPDERAQAENDLTAQLRSALAGAVSAGPEGGSDADLEAVVEASRRLALARQVHTDLARDARAVRRHPLVRVFGLARRHAQPYFFDINEPALDDVAERGPH